ncbi:hypothetical protein [Aliikangiella coralliicola]|uniref:Adhesin n=1 Tax=Aliikangiella coralliicola TaxID=2592383 RepID=A0A545UAK0_9GAMM|nr:hypothetical protein [Aliikangiella coralliicola]TQV86453.1 hypothetical protein FLL46_16175 [Aliikangiella coralliicola]
MKYLLSILLLSVSSSLFAADIVDACINCSEAEARHTALRGMEEFYYSSPQPTNPRRGKPAPKIFKTLHIFTNTGSEYGYSYVARIVNGGAVLVKAYDSAPTKGKNIFKAMHEYRVAYHKMIADAQSAMDYRFMQAVGKSHTKITPLDAMKGDDEAGGCSESDPNSSPFDYFTGNTRLDTNAAMRLELKNYSPDVEIKLQSINLSLGGSIGKDGVSVNGSVGGTLSIRDGAGHLRLRYTNRGQLVFDIRRNTDNTFYPTLNLNASTLGNGLNRNDNHDYGQGPGMDQFVSRDSGGNFKLRNGSYTFENNCIEKDWEELAKDLGYELVDQTGLSGGPFSAHCTPNGGTTSTTYRWDEFVQTSRIVGDKMIITGRWIERSATVSRGNPCS